MLGLISLLVFFVPGAEIRIRPDRQEQIKTVIVAASPKFASMAEGVLIPAQIETLAVTANGTLNTTGETGIPSDFARGEVELVNLSTDRIVIPAGTVVTASSDPTKRYQILNEITVDSANPAGVTTEIKASAPGATYNVPAGVINTIEAQFGLNVKVNNHLAIDGGKDLKIKSASQADYDQLKHNLMDELSQKAARGIEAKLQSGEVLTGSMVNLKQIIKEEASTQIGQPADSINLTVEAVFEGWIIKQNKLEEMAAAALLSDIPVGYEAVPGTLNVESLDKPVLSDHDLTWKVKAQQETRRHFELSQIQLEAAGKPVTQAAAELQNRYHLGKPPDIRVFPPVWPMMPLYFMRIDAVVE